jgi:hypothetical protein
MIFEHLALSLVKLFTYQEADVSLGQVARIFPDSFSVPLE